MPAALTHANYPEKAEQFAALARELRHRAKLTLQELSNRCGLAVSTISKMENGQLSPSYETILRLADGLQVDVAELFTAHSSASVATGRRSITRKGHGHVHSSPQYRYEMMNGDLSRKAFVPLVTTIQARSVSDFRELPSHDGEEFIYVVSGEVEIYSDHYEPERLGPGDTCYLDSTMGHACISVSAQDAVVVWITTPNEGTDRMSPKAKPAGLSSQHAAPGRARRTTSPASKTKSRP